MAIARNGCEDIAVCRRDAFVNRCDVALIAYPVAPRVFFIYHELIPSQFFLPAEQI
jgi:hypothetical protein